MATVPDSPCPHPDAALAAALAADLRAAGFGSSALRALWGADADDALARGMRHPVLRVLSDDVSPLATLGRLFVLGMPQPLVAVAGALPACAAEALSALGLVQVEGSEVFPLALVRPQSFEDGLGAGELLIASDLDEVALGGTLPADHVLGVGGASRTLAEIVVPTRVERALDVGTGCGIQALLLARHVSRVVATDISARALAFAELNAQLNGVSTIEFRRGDLFEPVAGELFDLVVSNPPFVITPRVASVPDYEYRDAGLVGDALVERFLRAAPSLLAPGGIAQLLGNWETRREAAGLDRVRSWIDEGTDAWVIERERLSPLAYAELWIRDGGVVPRDQAFDRMLSAWLDDFSTRDVTAIGFGYILLRRPFVSSASDRLSRFEHLPQPLHDPGAALAAGLAAHELLAAGIPDTLIAAPDVTEARHFLPGSDDPSVIELRQGGGFGRTVSVDPALAAFVGACDGELTAAQIVQALADLFEVPLGELWADLEPRIRQLLLDGFLLSASG